jgi:hypothetical protein
MFNELIRGDNKMKTVAKRFIGAVLINILIALSPGCKKDTNGGSLSVIMTDAPAPYDKVYVDIQSVQVHYDDNGIGEAGWLTLSTKAGVYDLLTLQNNVTAVLTSDNSLPFGHVTQLRLILGTNNIVVVGGVSFPLATPSADQSGLKINLDFTLVASHHIDVTIDFNAGNSIVIEGNGTYSLKPVITVKSIIQT